MPRRRIFEGPLAHHIARKDGGETTLGALFGHLAQLSFAIAVRQIVREPQQGVYQVGLCLSRQLCKQGPRLLEVECVEPFSEGGIDRTK